MVDSPAKSQYSVYETSENVPKARQSKKEYEDTDYDKNMSPKRWVPTNLVDVRVTSAEKKDKDEPFNKPLFKRSKDIQPKANMKIEDLDTSGMTGGDENKFRSSIEEFKKVNVQAEKQINELENMLSKNVQA